MCGIAGFVGRFEEATLGAMNDRIAARGPDDEGTLLLRPRDGDCAIGLAHRRLSIIDLSPDGHQPMQPDCGCCGSRRTGPPDRRLWLTYNGELYNFAALRDELIAKGHTFFSKTDSEVLLHLYAEEGPEMLARLNGIFAFALYDGRPSGQAGSGRPGDVLLVRDGFGVKPVYYSEQPEGVLFASELKALLAAPGIARDLDPIAIHNYMTYGWCPAPRTPLVAVRKMEPGEAIVLRDGRIVRRWTFYDAPYGRPPVQRSFEDAAEEARRHLRTAIERQLVADVDVGAFLSGGLDSSAIVATMRQLRPDAPIRCYCIGFADGGGLGGHAPDLPYARRVADEFNLNLEVLEIGPEIIEHLPEVLHILDEPQVDPAPISSLLIARRAREDGMKVLMSGQGGDDVFTGYRRHRALRLERLWGRLPRRLRRLGAAPSRAIFDGSARLPGADRQRVRQFARAFAHADLPDDERLIAYFYWSSEDLRRSLYSANLRNALLGHDSSAPLMRSLERIPDEKERVNRMLYLEKRHFLADHNLNYTDKTGMAAGIEVRVPFLDRDLVDWATRVPVDLKMRRGEPKALLKRAMEGILPHDVIHRPKTGFGAPMRRWLKRELRPVVEDVLSPASLSARGLFDPSAVADLVARDRAGRVDGAHLVFALICIELWCRTFVDGDGAAPAR